MPEIRSIGDFPDAAGEKVYQDGGKGVVKNLKYNGKSEV